MADMNGICYRLVVHNQHGECKFTQSKCQRIISLGSKNVITSLAALPWPGLQDHSGGSSRFPCPPPPLPQWLCYWLSTWLLFKATTASRFHSAFAHLTSFFKLYSTLLFLKPPLVTEGFTRLITLDSQLFPSTSSPRSSCNQSALWNITTVSDATAI